MNTPLELSVVIVLSRVTPPASNVTGMCTVMRLDLRLGTPSMSAMRWTTLPTAPSISSGLMESLRLAGGAEGELSATRNLFRDVTNLKNLSSPHIEANSA